MILGRINGKIGTNEFTFLVEGNAKKFDYVQVYHRDYEYVLCQIVEIERKESITTAKCNVIGYLDGSAVKQIRVPFEPDTEVLRAKDEFIQEIIRLETQNGAYIGYLDGKTIPVHLDLNKLLTKHLAILAKSGAGKSYSVGVLLEEIMDRNIPLLIIDPHGEHSQMKDPNDDDEDLRIRFNIEKKGYRDKIQEYGDPEINPDVSPLKISSCLSSSEIIHLLPARLSQTQQNVLFSALKDVGKIDFFELMHRLESEENNAKYSVINVVEYLYKLPVFSESPTSYNEIIQSGKCSIINLKGIDPQLQEIITAKLLTDLFELRKKEKIPPFFTVIEEAHTFCPERSFGETKASKILRTIASEGRKFGQGLCVVSQRPARVDKSVLSQCTTQLILKVTNPNDLKAISASVEGLSSDTEKEIVNLPIGTAIVTGIVDVPLIINIRPRKSRHGGTTVDMLPSEEFIEKLEEFEEKEILPIIKPRISPKEQELIEGRPIKEVLTYLVPAAQFKCTGSEDFSLLADLNKGGIIYDDSVYFLPDLDDVTNGQLRILKEIFSSKGCLDSDITSKGYSRSDIDMLTNRGFIRNNLGYLRINEEFLFSSLDTKKNFSKVEYTSISYSKKEDKNFDIDQMSLLLNKYVKVNDGLECWVVKHDIKFDTTQ